MKTSKVYLAFLCILVLSVASAGSAWALTAANTRIVNSATLTYDDGSGTRTTAPASVSVRVDLLPGAPIVTGSDMTAAYTVADTPLINTFTITANNTNGPDTYNLTAAITSQSNNSPVGAIHAISTASVTLGATITLSGCTKTSLNVPSDGVAGNGAVNSIVNGDTIVIGSDVATVSTITNSGSGTAIINLSGTGFLAAPGAGVLVAERQTMTVTVWSGTIQAAGTSIVIKKTLTATSTAPVATPPSTTSAEVTDTYTSGLATLAKYVRNISTPAAGGTIYSYPAAGTDYYLTGITAKPGEVLEYILVANNSGSGNATLASITDTLPITYVGGISNITYFNESGTPSSLTAAPGDDAATYASPTLKVNVGTGATSAAGGTIAAGATVRVLYRVTVNP